MTGRTGPMTAASKGAVHTVALRRAQAPGATVDIARTGLPDLRDGC